MGAGTHRLCVAALLLSTVGYGACDGDSSGLGSEGGAASDLLLIDAARASLDLGMHSADASETRAPDGAAISDAASDGAVREGGSADMASALPLPTAAPPCPPNVTRVTAISDYSDADRKNGSVHPELGALPAESALPSDPAADGAMGVLIRGVSIPRPPGETGQLAGTTYAPSLDAQSTAPGPHPLVVVLPGFGAQHTGYDKYSKQLATHGFLVLGMETGGGAFVAEHDLEAARVVHAITWMIDSGPERLNLDATKIAVAGHSKGGKLAFMAAALDPRVDLVIGWDPSNAGGPPCFIDPSGCHGFPAAPNCNAPRNAEGVLHRMQAESLILGVAPDLFNPEAAHNAIAFYRGAPSPSTYLFLAGSHGGFVTGFGGDGAIHDVTMRAQAGLLLRRFRNVTIDARFAPGGAAFDPAGIVMGAVRSK